MTIGVMRNISQAKGDTSQLVRFFSLTQCSAMADYKIDITQDGFN
jgi:hypothetical protein